MTMNNVYHLLILISIFLALKYILEFINVKDYPRFNRLSINRKMIIISILSYLIGCVWSF